MYALNFLDLPRSWIILPATCASDIKVAVRWSSFFLSTSNFFFLDYSSFVFCSLSLFHHQNSCFQLLLLVTATVVLNISYSLDPSLTFALTSMTHFLSLVSSRMLPKIYLKYSTNHTVIVPLPSSLYSLGSQPCTAKDVRDGSCSHVCVCMCVGVRSYFRVERELRNSCIQIVMVLMLAFFPGIDDLENAIAHLLWWHMPALLQRSFQVFFFFFPFHFPAIFRFFYLKKMI